MIRVKVSNLGVNKFRSLLRKKAGREGFGVVILVEANKFMASGLFGNEGGNMRLQELLSKYMTVFRDDLPASLLPKRDIDHEIQLKDGTRTPNRPLFQLSPE